MNWLYKLYKVGDDAEAKKIRNAIHLVITSPQEVTIISPALPRRLNHFLNDAHFLIVEKSMSEESGHHRKRLKMLYSVSLKKDKTKRSVENAVETY